MKYYLCRNDENECYSVFEYENNFVQKIYPHTQDSLSFEILENLIQESSESVVFCSVEEANNLSLPPISSNVLAKKIREERDTKLTESDWTQVADAPVDQAAWATYRQALRDIPTHANFPNLTETDWPTKPE